MLEFIYTGELSKSWYIRRNHQQGQNIYIDLLSIGHMYNLKKLVNACALKLAEKLDRQNIFVMLELAENLKLAPWGMPLLPSLPETSNILSTMQNLQRSSNLRPIFSLPSCEKLSNRKQSYSVWAFIVFCIFSKVRQSNDSKIYPKQIPLELPTYV